MRAVTEWVTRTYPPSTVRGAEHLVQRRWGAGVAPFSMTFMSLPGQHTARTAVSRRGTVALRVMDEKNPTSRFVRSIMAGASEGEIEEATRYWFEYLRLLAKLGDELADADSAASDSYVRFRDETQNNV